MNRQIKCDCLTLVAVMAVFLLLIFSVAATADSQVRYDCHDRGVVATNAPINDMEPVAGLEPMKTVTVRLMTRYGCPHFCDLNSLPVGS